MIRNGYLAVWNDTEYDASPAPDGTVRLYATAEIPGFQAIAVGRYRRVVPASEISALHYVQTRCEWRGARFVVLGQHDTWLRVEYLEDDAQVAESLGLEWFDVGVYQGWAPWAEVTGLREEVT